MYINRSRGRRGQRGTSGYRYLSLTMAQWPILYVYTDRKEEEEDTDEMPSDDDLKDLEEDGL